MIDPLCCFVTFWLVSLGLSQSISDIDTHRTDEVFDIFALTEGRDETSKFKYDAVEDIKRLFPSQTCVPHTFGYSKDKALKIFPEYLYPRCEEKYSDIDIPWIELDLPNGKFTLHCNSNNTEHYITGPGKLMTFPMKEEIFPQIQVKDLDGREGQIGPLDEYIVASCFGKLNVIEQWVRPNLTEYERVSKARDQTSKPILLLMLVVDSFSRRHFFQKLPETVEYLSTLKSDYVAEDFKLHNVIGDGSAHNTIPIFSKFYSTRDTEGRNYQDNLGEMAIWTDLKKQNFMNLLLTESCDSQFPKNIGRFPKIDHISRQMYCALSTVGEYQSAKGDRLKQRCIGPHMPHYYAFDYIKKFANTYANANLWIYTHLTAAHEASGQHAQTLDHDLTAFLQEFLDLTKSTHEVVIMLHGDHGMRFGDWKIDLAAVQEHKLPVFFLIASRTLLESIPNALDTVRTNTWRLFSKKDIRRTLLWLSHYPDLISLPQEDSLQHFNLLTETLPTNRTCLDAGVPVWYCSCLEMEGLPLDDRYKSLTDYSVAYAIELMNREVYSKFTGNKASICEKLTGGRTLSLAGMNATDTDQLFRVDFSVGNKVDSQFSATLLVSPNPYQGAVKSHQEKYYLGGIEPFVFESSRNFVKVIALSRVDTFEGPCEDKSRKAGLKADYCFCIDTE